MFKMKAIATSHLLFGINSDKATLKVWLRYRRIEMMAVVETGDYI